MILIGGKVLQRDVGAGGTAKKNIPRLLKITGVLSHGFRRGHGINDGVEVELDDRTAQAPRF